VALDEDVAQVVELVRLLRDLLRRFIAIEDPELLRRDRVVALGLGFGLLRREP
jgi:hypothetical protein